MAPVFYLQIVKPDGTVVQLPAGGALELDLIESAVAIVAQLDAASTPVLADPVITALTDAIMHQLAAPVAQAEGAAAPVLSAHLINTAVEAICAQASQITRDRRVGVFTTAAQVDAVIADGLETAVRAGLATVSVAAVLRADVTETLTRGAVRTRFVEAIEAGMADPAVHATLTAVIRDGQAALIRAGLARVLYALKQQTRVLVRG